MPNKKNIFTFLIKKIVLELWLTFQKQIYTIFSKEKTDLMIRIFHFNQKV
jgi:hypothetical protein